MKDTASLLHDVSANDINIMELSALTLSAQHEAAVSKPLERALSEYPYDAVQDQSNLGQDVGRLEVNAVRTL